MDQSKIHELIGKKNEDRERSALRTAESIIEEIAAEQTKIAAARKKIEELRKGLKDLSVETLDPRELLGE